MKGKLEVVHITTVHDPFDTRIFRKECCSLVNAGHQVILIAPHTEQTSVKGVQIDPISPPTNRAERITTSMMQAYRKAQAHDADLYHLHDPELIPLGLLLKARGKCVVQDVHEDVARDIETKYWIPSVLRIPIARCYRLLEQLTTHAFDATVVATPSIARLFSTNQTTLVQNFPLIDELTPNESPRPFSERPNMVAYVGDLTRIRGVCEMVSAMSRGLPSDSRLRIAGTFSPPELKEEVAALSGWSSVEFLGWQSRAEVANLFGMAQAGLVTFLPAPNHLRAQPNKLFEYMSAGLPVIASNFPLWREIINEADCGLLVDPTRPAEIAEAVRWIFEHPDEAEAMGRRGQRAVKERFNWNTEFSNLKNLYQSLLT